MKLLLAGTIKFSAKIFEHLIKNYEIVGIISQPNRKLNRKKELLDTEVAELAKKYNIKLFQPEKISEIYDELSDLDFDFLITAAFGQFIPTKVLNLAKIASINIHGSLLEKYRGAAPIQHAFLNNEKEMGITLIYMTKEMDAGDMIAKAKFEVQEEDTALEAYEKMADLAIENIDSWLEGLYTKTILATKQDISKVTYAPKISNEEGEITQDMTKKQALAKIKALNNQPGAFLFLNQKRIKVFRATEKKIQSPLKVMFSDGYLYFYEYQYEGKKIVKHEL
ncbi:methionyl-tRNA formyltransferase [Mycoplasma zalophi]|uniref:Methionyl-tRNA formyltransferase n=1 Tax=Mycoplasma zalophi TaxID=191287 RepID=A0ABS6DPF4_9MOLU|nr:methionyl-tRNA formyltransferase [Mycoplasma zalophi]MBU4691180.1 methionyl-tRNA formyltransferase [Mycoplasma zalophi]MBU4692046.1 methionyl-tRNA formyltransferase [Mycoplasma zalophi]